ncbi:hypothetical protein [Shewanella aestuarii]|uniref:Uncharacterized protein n=1 Tax=Shewanella aestuarii TaxID=1028752 RepID=A0A6G9QJ27_9GAMM|nr:hypothetical protein [Shewanella aestuarii]QIR14472.1 hypothetical protein HBH39_08230 [Shewanella aestuarii]
MLKSIFAVSIFCRLACVFTLLATASAVANPLSLFTEQCLQFHTQTSVPIPSAWLKKDGDQLVVKASPEVHLQQIVDFEAGLLSLHNLNDLNNYYRSQTSAPEYQQALLMCQVHLADELTWLASQLDSNKLTSSAYQSLDTNTPYQVYSAKLASLLNRQWPQNTKALKHSLQANIEHYFSKKYQLTLPDICQLKEEAADEHQADFNTEQSIAFYLAHQQDEQCRKQAWIAYQIRAKDLIKPSLLKLHQLQTDFSKQRGYQNFTDYQLSFQGLTENQVEIFLASQTHNINQAPWNLITQLKKIPKSHQPKVSTALLLQTAFQQLEQLDIHFEQIDLINPSSKQQVYRIWHKQRLLGELYLHWFDEASSSPTDKLAGALIKYPVLGHQFGQYSLQLPQELTDTTQMRLLTLLSESISLLAKSGQFYYFNQQSVDSSSAEIGSLWLAKWLSRALDKPQIHNPRLVLIKQYQQQHQVFKSKVALYFYRQNNVTNWPWVQPMLDAQISQAFQRSFGHDWPQASDAIYSLQAIANQGINHYLLLWQQTLAELIMNEVNNDSKAKEIFELLVVNEHNQTLYDQLSAIYLQPMDFEKLIWRINHAGSKQE